jgi:F0F1-type ATP synthase assembly protein I
MGELNEEKLKQMLDEHAMNVQASINDVYKEIKGIKNTLERQEGRSAMLWISAVGIALVGISVGMFSFAHTTSDKAISGGVAVFGVVVCFVGLYLYPKITKR